jgi:Na+(H+)/acetate symporter ActP
MKKGARDPKGGNVSAKDVLRETREGVFWALITVAILILTSAIVKALVLTVLEGPALHTVVPFFLPWPPWRRCRGRLP